METWVVILGLSKSFSDRWVWPDNFRFENAPNKRLRLALKKQRDECMSDKLHVHKATSTCFERVRFSSTPHHNCTSYPLSGTCERWRWYQTREEIVDIVSQKVAKRVQPLHARITKLEETNTNLHQQLDESKQ